MSLGDRSQIYAGRRQHQATPWRSKPGDPTYRVPTGDLARHRQFNPSIETPEQMYDATWYRGWDPEDPPTRIHEPNNFSSGGGSEGSTEEGLVDAFESGAKLPPAEVFTNGPHAWLSDGNHRVNVADMLGHPDLETYIHYDPHQPDSFFDPHGRGTEGNYGVGNTKVDPDSELGRQIHKLVQNHPYEPVDGGPTTDHVFRRHPETGEWQRGKITDGAPYIVDTQDYAKQMQAEVPGYKHDGLGHYFDVDWGNGPEITHERHLHARRT
ncbi:hypothetical protein Cali_119 [Mycobacterium phage Cali]|uniref:ParB-like nuclease domain protein n=5 Tax=Bixzunavirus TaxID=680114 RepID=A0A411CC78_9CAUD|nr:gp119 [Mycobacterium phage Cali]YP_010057526.1 hypothetical protein KHO60_gp194 [Mycobacterium phage CharlieB]YP_010058213.1 hypothetical protein KHO63_gp189 [Mycobacterium phage QBert]AGV99840.1 hypothetical protein PBI_SHRIMP_124 [Mycobacterium phage Shrimp]ALF50983.1 hypothetical protein SEA_DTDEVON_124 [Mycobacterium phage DTDevon]AYD83589.1 hypothetical protein SEA_FUDGETART_122 [Mycobacterium phage FudgeTart]ACH63101.1 hypothetical protein Cali_119 [Mycobacterium phage Cali]AYP69540